MSEQPHILFLMTDQHSPHVVGCYGDSHVRTVALDRLAGEGVVFDAAYCDNPLCVPSRMSMLTGKHGHQLGIWTNDDALDSTTPTVAHGLGIAGYRTVLVGRMHFVGGDQHHGFQERRAGDVTSQYLGMNRAEHRFRGYWGGRESLENAGEGNSYDLAYDTMVAMEASRVIRDHEVSGDPRPLFMVVSFYSPHDPYVMPAERLAPYLQFQDEPIDPDPESPPSFTREKIGKADFSSVDPDTRHKARAAYRAKTQFVDELMGQVLAAWADSPLADNAVTVYTSDHGDMQGEHGLWAKGSFYEASARVPLIMSAPGRLTAGERIDRPVGLIDLIPTLLEIGGAPALPEADGKSFWQGVVKKDQEAWPSFVFSETGQPEPARMVRKDNFKFIIYSTHEDELYDLANDPDELCNLAADPRYADTCRELRQAITEDGWDSERIRAEIEKSKPERDYLFRYARVLEPKDPWQWGLPAQI